MQSVWKKTCLAWALLGTVVLTGCATAPSRQGRIWTVGHSIVIAQTENWDEVYITPTAFDDNARIERRETEAGTEFAVEKTAGEGRRLDAFSGAIGALVGLFAGSAL